MRPESLARVVTCRLVSLSALQAYGLQCLDYWLSSPSGEPLKPDLVYFNFGLHDGPLGNATVPGQQGNTTNYASQLRAIAVKLKATGSRLIFGARAPRACHECARWAVHT